jgi:hypothetical protein
LKRTLTDTPFYVKNLILVLVVRSFATPSQNKIPSKKRDFRNDTKVATNLMKVGKFENL